MNRFSFKEILVDVKSNGFGDDVEVSSREVILGTVADGLERESRGMSSRDSKGRHSLMRKDSKEGSV